MLLQLGEAEEAAEVLTQATRAAPGNRLLWTMLGMAYRDSLSFKKAKQALQTASQLDPRYQITFSTTIFRVGFKGSQASVQSPSLCPPAPVTRYSQVPNRKPQTANRKVSSLLLCSSSKM